MDLNERRKELNRRLKDQLPDFIVAAAPDHPLLMRGPDFLIGGDGALTAIFSPSQEEKKNPRLLGNRLILSRLAMPPHTRNLLVMSERPAHRLATAFANDFAVILDWKDRYDIGKIARDRNFTGAQEDVPEEIRYSAKKQFSDVIQVTQLMKRIDARQNSSNYDEYRRKPQKSAAYISIQSEKENTVKAIFSEGTINTRSISKLVNDQITTSYSLDNSIPYPRPELYYGLAIVQELPNYRGDPDKLLRAAAFGGWAIISQRQRNLAPDLIERLSERREARKQWR